jgi:transcriptional regulator with XRE-family HTH domain
MKVQGQVRMSQDELAELTGLAKRTIARIEQGVSESPHKRTLEDIQQVFEGRGIHFLFKNGVGVGITVEDINEVSLG